VVWPPIRYGGGINGNIVNEYTLTDIAFPFIRISDFSEEDTGQLDTTFVIFSLSALLIEYSTDGLRLIVADIINIPAPGTLTLFRLGLLGLRLVQRKTACVETTGVAEVRFMRGFLFLI